MSNLDTSSPNQPDNSDSTSLNQASGKFSSSTGIPDDLLKVSDYYVCEGSSPASPSRPNVSRHSSDLAQRILVQANYEDKRIWDHVIPNSKLLNEAINSLKLAESLRPLISEIVFPSTMLAKSLRPLISEIAFPSTMLAESLHSTIGSTSAMLAESLRPPMLSLASTSAMLAESLRLQMPDLARLAGGIIESTRSISFSIRPALDSFTFLLPDTKWITVLTNQINDCFATIPGLLPESFRQFTENLKQRLLRAFRRAGLCLAPSMSEDLMYQILDQVETGSLRGVTLLVWNYYARKGHAKLQQTVGRWQTNSEYAKRWSHILAALDSHIRGIYVASMRTLAPEIEGIAMQVVKQNSLKETSGSKKGKLNLGATRSTILRALQKVGDEALITSSSMDITLWVRLESILAFIKEDFCNTLDFEADYDRIRKGKYRLNRHSLLHGIQVEGFSALNSLRLFIILDTIHDLLQIYSAHGGII